VRATARSGSVSVDDITNYLEEQQMPKKLDNMTMVELLRYSRNWDTLSAFVVEKTDGTPAGIVLTLMDKDEALEDLLQAIAAVEQKHFSQ